VKKSTIEGGGYGVFAARPYSWGDALGVFYGNISVKKPHQKRSIYAMEVAWPPDSNGQTSMIVDPTWGPAANKKAFEPSFFGLHMANDPEWGGRSKKKGPTTRNATRDEPAANFMIDVSLVGMATRDIAAGDELFLNYDGDAY
jgi:hypothetical protein